MKLDEKRNLIDDIDARVIELLNDRLTISREIGVLKMAAGLPVCDAQREDEVLRRLVARNTGPIGNAGIINIYRTVLAESRRLQSAMRAAVTPHGATE